LFKVSGLKFQVF